MKFIIPIILLAFFTLPLSAQEELFTPPDSISMPNDMIVLNLLGNQWLNAPSNIEQMPVSIGTEFYAMSPVFGKKSNFSMNIGLGVSGENIHTNALPATDTNFVTIFSPIPGGYEYTKNKFTNVYLDVPIEVKLRTNPNGKKRNFKVSLGFKVGYLVANYIKYKGEDYIKGTSEIIKYKSFNIDNVKKYRYSAFIRVGYGKFNLICNYTLSELFDKAKGPNVVPVSAGLSFTFL